MSWSQDLSALSDIGYACVILNKAIAIVILNKAITIYRKESLQSLALGY